MKTSKGTSHSSQIVYVQFSHHTCFSSAMELPNSANLPSLSKVHSTRKVCTRFLQNWLRKLIREGTSHSSQIVYIQFLHYTRFSIAMELHNFADLPSLSKVHSTSNVCTRFLQNWIRKSARALVIPVRLCILNFCTTTDSLKL